jgi:thiol-disulfide isomerase/thioredoxin
VSFLSVKLKRPSLSRRSVIAAVPGLALAASAGNRAAAQDDALPDAAGVLTSVPPAPAPALRFTDAKGKPLSLGAYKGHALVVNLWATWCGPCGMELPSLDDLAPRLAAFGAKVLAISIDDDGTTSVPRFYEQTGIENLPVLLNLAGDDLDILNVDGIPATIIVDPQGRMVAQLEGAADWNTDAVVALVKSLQKPAPRKQGGVTPV